MKEELESEGLARIPYIWEEVVGILEQIYPFEIGLMLMISGKMYFLPGFPFEMLGDVWRLKGQRMGILRTDRGYVVRSERQRLSRLNPECGVRAPE